MGTQYPPALGINMPNLRRKFPPITRLSKLRDAAVPENNVPESSTGTRCVPRSTPATLTLNSAEGWTARPERHRISNSFSVWSHNHKRLLARGADFDLHAHACTNLSTKIGSQSPSVDDFHHRHSNSSSSAFHAHRRLSELPRNQHRAQLHI